MDIILLDLGDDIKGESLHDGYIGGIELLSFSHGVAQQITGDQSNTKRTSGKPNHQDFTCTKYMDLASTSLVAYCNQAKPIAKATLRLGQNEDGKVVWYMVYELTNVLLSSVTIGGGGAGKPIETITLNYTAITWAYKLQKSDVSDAGNASAKWNLATNTAE
ncbi:MAG: type VI secretion system tube protein Hcp [Acidobacteria bacterium]|nr:type VI secretion system tube protein Hcp [Acidobacteriota bacterium]